MSPSKPANGEKPNKKEDFEEEVVHPDDADDLIIKDVADGSDEVVDEVGEIDKRSFEEDTGKQMEIGRTSEATNVDNEDSLNLTIGEDEEKIFQEEESEVKQKSKGDSRPEKAEKKESKSCETANEKKSSATSKVEEERDEKKTSGGGGDKNAENESAGKKEDSEQKATTTKSSAKDEKESSSKTSTSKSTASRNLWVSGLSSLTRATDLKIIFSKYGKVIGAKVVTNTRTPGTRCYGYVTMGSSSDASKCIEHLHRTELHGRIISVEKAKSDIGIVKTASKSDTKEEDSAAEKSERKKVTEKDNTKDVKKESTTLKREDSKPSDDTKKREIERKRDPPVRPRITARVSRERQDAGRKPVRPRPTASDREREVLSFQKIREERERQRLRERERKVREEERRRQESRRRQRDEEERLIRERERLKKERERLERERADLLRLERERQKLEREKIELERLELKRQQLKIEEAKRAIKRPASNDHDRERYTEVDRKRPSTSDRHFEPPPPPRFDTNISSRSTGDYRSSDKKRIDDFSSQKRDDYKRDSFKRPVPEYSKREMEPSRHSGGSSSFDNRSVPMHRSDGISSSSSKDRYTIPPSENRGAPSSFSSRVRDERDSRYMESGSNSDSRYTERSSSTAWPNTGPPSVKPFGHMQSVAANDPWGQKQSESGWRSMEQNQDRYDRTYNERKSQSGPSQYIDQPRQNSFIGRPQDRYSNAISSRFENGRF